MSNKYIVVWMEREIQRVGANGLEAEEKEIETDYYIPFIDGTSDENKAEAEKLYREKLRDDKVYTANLCIIMKSTDYTIDGRPMKEVEKQNSN